ncbi:trimeric intracellular cation channel family protein [Xanthobacteraceae bacterium A53D]
MSSATFILALDLIGTFVFALSGGIAGTQRGADLFGVLVLAFVTAVAGGVMRDLALGAVPPAALANWHMLALSVAGGLAAFSAPRLVGRLRLWTLVFDAAGLGVFAVTGTQKALDYGLTPLMAAILGVVTGIGGGMVRDVLTMQVPVVLRADIYAVAAFLGAIVVAGCHMAGIGIEISAPVGIGLCFALRLLAIHRRWNLPVARGSTRAGEG